MRFHIVFKKDLFNIDIVTVPLAIYTYRFAEILFHETSYQYEEVKIKRGVIFNSVISKLDPETLFLINL